MAVRLAHDIEVDAIGFDLDHTLGFDDHLELQAMLRFARAAAQREGRRVDAELEPRAYALLAAARAGDRTIDDAVTTLLSEYLPTRLARAETERWRKAVTAEAPAATRAARGMRRALARLEARGVPLAILTNGWSPLQEAKAEALGLAHLPILVSEKIGALKPAPQAFDALVQRLGARPDRTAFVGDDLDGDVLGARAASLAAVWVPEHEPTERQLRALPDRVLTVRSLGELAQ